MIKSDKYFELKGYDVKQLATRVDDAEYELFKETAAAIGTTTADALRVFVHAFNSSGGFPFEVIRRANKGKDDSK